MEKEGAEQSKAAYRSLDCFVSRVSQKGDKHPRSHETVWVSHVDLIKARWKESTGNVSHLKEGNEALGNNAVTFC